MPPRVKPGAPVQALPCGPLPADLGDAGETPTPQWAMLRRAEWRRLPGDPRSTLGWWWRESRLPLLLAGIVFPTVALILILAIALKTTELAFIATIPILLTVFLSTRVGRTRGLDLLPPSPAPVEAFPVECAFSYRDVLTGLDHGVASFVDGWLHVEGLRTGFSVRPVDLAQVAWKPGGWCVLELPGGQRVAFRSLGTPADRETLGETVRVWRLFSGGSTPGEPTLPPLWVHPTARTRLLTALAVLFVGDGLLLALTVWVLAARPESFGALVPMLVAMVVVGRSGPKTVRDLRSLGKIERMALEADAGREG